MFTYIYTKTIANNYAICIRDFLASQLRFPDASSRIQVTSTSASGFKV